MPLEKLRRLGFDNHSREQDCGTLASHFAGSPQFDILMIL